MMSVAESKRRVPAPPLPNLVLGLLWALEQFRVDFFPCIHASGGE